MRSLNIAIAHYLTGERDGVSLEIEKRARAAQQLGGTVSLISGFDGLHRPNAHVISELQLSYQEAVFLKEQMFVKQLISDSELEQRYHTLEEQITNKLMAIWKSAPPDLLFIHNIFSHAFNLPATTAFLRVLDVFQTPTVCIHHDFWFERPKFIKPTNTFVEHILDSIPPERHYIIKHQVINSLSATALQKRRSIIAERIGDYFDYDKPIPKPATDLATLRKSLEMGENDIIVLQATRITERKAIENAIRYVATLQKKIPEKNLHLLFPNFVEVDSHRYHERLKKLADTLQVHAIWAENMFTHEKFWEAYHIADIVTYPSIQEGFGNQFLEAIYFRKLIVMFEYEVYRKDIKPEGYSIVSLGDKTKRVDEFEYVPQSVIDDAVAKSINLMHSPEELASMTEHNYEIAKKNHNETRLVEDMSRIFSTIRKS